MYCTHHLLFLELELYHDCQILMIVLLVYVLVHVAIWLPNMDLSTCRAAFFYLHWGWWICKFTWTHLNLWLFTQKLISTLFADLHKVPHMCNLYKELVRMKRITCETENAKTEVFHLILIGKTNVLVYRCYNAEYFETYSLFMTLWTLG